MCGKSRWLAVRFWAQATRFIVCYLSRGTNIRNAELTQSPHGVSEILENVVTFH